MAIATPGIFGPPMGVQKTIAYASAFTVAWNEAPVQDVTLAGNPTITLAGSVPGGRYLLALIQDGTGSRTVTWPGGMKWVGGGTPPTLTATANAADLISIVYLGITPYGAPVLNYQ